MKIYLLSYTVLFGFGSSIQAMYKPVRIRTPHQTSLFKPHSLVQKRLYNPTELKGLYTSFKEDKKHFSPVHGALLAESSLLKNLYRFGPKNSALIKLISDQTYGLFHKQGEQFRPTQHKSLPAYSLNPTLIGSLVALMESKTLFSDTPERQDFLHKWSMEHNKVTGKKLKEEKMLGFIDLIQESLKESDSKNNNARYYTHLPYGVLTAFLYKKAQNKNDMLEYYQGLKNYHPEELSVGDFKVSPYIDTEYMDFRYAFLPNNAIHDYEKAAASIIYSKYKAKTPPQVIQGYTGYCGKKPVPTCFETAMRDLINILVYNPENQMFDLTMLPTSINPAPELRDFYTQHSSALAINNEQINQAWMNIVSGKNLDYKQTDYELRSRISNVVNLCNILFGINATSIEQLGILLSDERRTVTCSIMPEPKENCKNTIIKITIQNKQDNASLNLTLEIDTDRHTQLQIQDRFNNKFLHTDQSEIYSLLTKKEKSIVSSDNNIKMNVFSIFSSICNHEIIVTCDKNPEESTDAEYLIFANTRLDNPNVRSALLLNRWDKMTNDVRLALMKSFDNDAWSFKREICLRILQTPYIEQDEYRQYVKYTVFDAVYNKKETLDKYLESLLEKSGLIFV